MIVFQGAVSSARRTRVLRAAAGRIGPIEGPPLISEELFREALVRERRRADRFEETFVLILISINSDAARQPRWGQVVEALAQSKFDADVIGWFEQGSVVGLIRSLVDGDSRDSATTVADSVRGELVRCLTPDNVDCCSIRLEVYSPRSDSIPPVLVDAGDESRKLQDVARDAAKRLLDFVGSTAFLIAST